MKYTESNKPLVCMMTQSTCYKGTTKMTPKGVLWHSTGANNPNLKRYVQPDDNAPDRAELLALLGTNTAKNDFNHINREAGLNAWIGKLADGSVTSVQTMPWDYKPWGCGGACNNGWMQFEICEDGLTDKNYFETVYKEACELTAYYCKMYNLDPKGTVSFNGKTVPVILCHADSYKLGLGSNHGDVLHWFKKHGKTMEDVRNDVAEILNPSVKPTSKPVTGEIYRVRKSWTDAASQVGAYSVLDNAKDACDKAGAGYEVYDSKGKVVYPVPKAEPVKTNPTLRKGSKGEDVKTLQTKLTNLGYSLGSIDGSFGGKTEAAVIAFQKDNDLERDGVCGPKTWAALNSAKYYTAQVTASALNVRSGAGTSYKVNKVIKKGTKVIVVSEKNGWARLINSAGYVSLDYIKKV